MIRNLLGAALSVGLLGMATVPAFAASAEDLTCLEDQLNNKQRAAIGALFAEQTDDPTEERKLAKGSEAASGDFAAAIGGCTNRFNWNNVQRERAEQYLIRLGAVSQIAVANGERWAAAMEKYARFGVRLLPKEGDPNEHERVMIAAGAHANGVPAKAGDEDEESPILAYLAAVTALEAARRSF